MRKVGTCIVYLCPAFFPSVFNAVRIILAPHFSKCKHGYPFAPSLSYNHLSSLEKKQVHILVFHFSCMWVALLDSIIIILRLVISHYHCRDWWIRTMKNVAIWILWSLYMPFFKQVIEVIGSTIPIYWDHFNAMANKCLIYALGNESQRTTSAN